MLEKFDFDWLMVFIGGFFVGMLTMILAFSFVPALLNIGILTEWLFPVDSYKHDFFGVIFVVLPVTYTIFGIIFMFLLQVSINIIRIFIEKIQS